CARNGNYYFDYW
nr:immunoglobulin heavy chain junction region [Mus musculus]NSM04438.1 immunoglobulin heavy chain junction region [Mus musculus]NSM04910.1 immunoglobulin heavy chain junction region [Mus musculus]NSM04933.1 immunoglobulin heavy chain junction region [Mus musculus]NSM05167.1 immunoglobulin heavy chain junction region [Mus musculus]